MRRRRRSQACSSHTDESKIKPSHKPHSSLHWMRFLWQPSLFLVLGLAQNMKACIQALYKTTKNSCIRLLQQMINLSEMMHIVLKILAVIVLISSCHFPCCCYTGSTVTGLSFCAQKLMQNGGRQCSRWRRKTWNHNLQVQLRLLG